MRSTTMAKSSVLLLFLLAIIPLESLGSPDECRCKHGICSGKDGYDQCFCYDGYTGDDCSINFDECLPGRNPCQNDAVCVNDVPEVRCDCPPGYCGRYCEMEIDECRSNPCHNGATCIDQLNGFKCICPLGYTGVQCETDIDACMVYAEMNGTWSGGPCQNGATCKDGPGERYFCICPPGYIGQNCETIMDPCDSSPCLNGARCERTRATKLGSFRCICPYGWSGSDCQVQLKRCSSRNQCKNNALCMSPLDDRFDDHFHCFCRPDFHGKLCQLRFDECSPNNCQNGATCLDQVDGHQCLCPGGFAGPFCEIDCLEEDHEACYFTTTTIITTTTTVSSSTIMSTIPEPSWMPEDSRTVSTTIPTISRTLSTPYLDQFTSSSSLVLTTAIMPNVTTETRTILVTPTFGIESSWLIPEPDGFKPDNVSMIYAASFDGNQSELIFQMRRIKRTTSSVKLTIISSDGGDDDGFILHAYTNKFNLLLYVKNRNIVAELNDRSQQNLLHLQSNHPIEMFKPYTIKVTIDAEATGLNAELRVYHQDRMIQSVNIQKPNLTVPCFEWFRFGQPPPPPSLAIDHHQLFPTKPFKGCIYNFEFNNQEKFVRDSFSAKNISECLSNVCQHNPCLNNGVCHHRRNQASGVAAVSPYNNNNQTTAIWNCSCPDGYRGWLCEEIYCHSGYCANGGLCLLGDLLGKHLCVCPQGFFGSRCEFKMNLTFPAFNIATETNNRSSFIKYRLTSYNIEEFFEIRFRFITQIVEQRSGLLVFMSRIMPNGGVVMMNPDTNHQQQQQETATDFVSLIYEKRSLYLRLNLGQGEETLKTSTEPNITEQMVLFGRFRQVFWLLVIPSRIADDHRGSGGVGGEEPQLRPQVGRTPLHQKTLNVDPYLYVGGHEDWHAHPALQNLTGFKGCIYDIEIRISRQSDFRKIDENLIDNLANIDQCDFECT